MVNHRIGTSLISVYLFSFIMHELNLSLLNQLSGTGTRLLDMYYSWDCILMLATLSVTSHLAALLFAAWSRFFSFLLINHGIQLNKFSLCSTNVGEAQNRVGISKQVTTSAFLRQYVIEKCMKNAKPQHLNLAITTLWSMTSNAAVKEYSPNQFPVM